jgi:hypothetical protein
LNTTACGKALSLATSLMVRARASIQAESNTLRRCVHDLLAVQLACAVVSERKRKKGRKSGARAGAAHARTRRSTSGVLRD